MKYNSELQLIDPEVSGVIATIPADGQSRGLVLSADAAAGRPDLLSDKLLTSPPMHGRPRATRYIDLFEA